MMTARKPPDNLARSWGSLRNIFFFPFFFFFVTYVVRPCNIALTALKLRILLSQAPKCWD